MPKCVVLEQDEDLLEVLTDELPAAGWVVLPAASPSEAKRLARADQVDVFLADERSLAPDGSAGLEWFRGDEVLAALPLVVMTAPVPDASGHARYLTVRKPFTVQELDRMLRLAIRPSVH